MSYNSTENRHRVCHMTADSLQSELARGTMALWILVVPCSNLDQVAPVSTELFRDILKTAV
jgi:hypothetical protein